MWLTTEKQKVMEDLCKRVREHVGHEISYYGEGKFDHKGVLLRAQIETKGFSSLVLYLQNKPFPIKIYFDQFTACHCGRY